VCTWTGGRRRRGKGADRRGPCASVWKRKRKGGGGAGLARWAAEGVLGRPVGLRPILFFVLCFPFIFSVFPFMQFSNQLKNNSDKFLKIPIRYQCKAILKENILSLFLFDKTLSKIKMCRVY
jgi:hypothetical protein